MKVTIDPAGAGRQLVRTSIPFARGTLGESARLVVHHGESTTVADVRPLTFHAAPEDQGKWVRRALVTFPYDFDGDGPVEVTLESVTRPESVVSDPPANVSLAGGVLTVAHANGSTVTARVVAPQRTSDEPARKETVESSRLFLWERYHLDDPAWPRTVEVRVDRAGTVTLVAHLQRKAEGYDYCPDFGWGGSAEGAPGPMRVYDPTAELRGKPATERVEEKSPFTCEHLTWVASDKAPMQQASWRRTEIVIAPAELAKLTPTLAYPHQVVAAPEMHDELYATGRPLNLQGQPKLAQIIDYHHNAVVRSMARGADWGNVTGYRDGGDRGGVFGMNRLNHCPPIFEEAWRTGDRRLSEVGVLWCDNMHDQSLWWGPGATGGTRYNNLNAMGKESPFGDRSYMWRSNSAVNFCTKGYDAFFLAYEQTGDPRMLRALEAQVAYASQHVHSNTGEARNIGDVRDFVRLYRYTGEQRRLDEALRLFRELREKLSTGDLFSQSGRPLEPDPPFIDDDHLGYQHPFAKPYIIGYALAGLPELAALVPDEPKLRDVIQAVADFLSESMDPLGGWRYPHPRSSHMILSQGIEHAWQLVQADKFLGAQGSHLDAVEAVLRQRIQCWLKTGKCLNGLGGWELATGRAKSRQELYKLYKRPADREFERDYREGDLSVGGSSPEGIVYFPEVLAFYLEHRPADRLLTPPKEEDPLGIVLSRLNST